MSKKFALDLTDLAVGPLEAADMSDSPTLEAIVGGHMMTEVGASIIGQGIFLCSCCCC
jgi:hypothetical protein